MKNKILYFILGALSALGSLFAVFIYWSITDDKYRARRNINERTVSYRTYYRRKKDDTTNN